MSEILNSLFDIKLVHFFLNLTTLPVLGKYKIDGIPALPYMLLSCSSV